MDYGYPQILSALSLKQYIKVGTVKANVEKVRNASQAPLVLRSGRFGAGRTGRQQPHHVRDHGRHRLAPARKVPLQRERGLHRRPGKRQLVDVERMSVLSLPRFRSCSESAAAVVLRSDVSGKIMLKVYLTGMPECQFGLNDKVMLDREGRNKR
jgi:hypothetical protein